VLRLRLTLLAFALTAAACSLPLTEAQQEAGETSTTLDDGPASTPPTTRPRPQAPTLPPLDEGDAGTLARIPGRLAVGSGPFVAVVNPDGSNGVLVGGGDGVIATQPTWSSEGALIAWSEASPNASAITVFDPASGGSLTSALAGPPAFYLQWNSSDQLIAYLRNDTEGNGVEAGVVRPGEISMVYDRGAPHYFQWAPERDFWVSHVGNERLALVSVDEVVDLPEPLGPFATPQWIDEDRFLFAGPDGLRVFDLTGAEGARYEVTTSALSFTVNPGGTHVAYLQPPTDDDVGGLRVLALDTGDVETVTTDQVVVWEWSPNGERLAWTGLDRADAANLARLHVWDRLTSTEISTTPSFRPSDLSVSSYYPFFTQYSVSHTSWSPDSSAFAFAGSIDGDTGIWVHVVADPESELEAVDAARIAVGDVAFWSPDDAAAAEPAPAPF
jgi:TolB protein